MYGGDHKKQMDVLVSGVKEIKLLAVPRIGIKLKGKYDTIASSAIKKEFEH